MLKTYFIDGCTFDLGKDNNLDYAKIKEIINIGMRGNPKIRSIKYNGSSTSWYDNEKEREDGADPQVVVIAFEVETGREWPDDTIEYKLLCFDNHNETRMNVLLVDTLLGSTLYCLGHHAYI